MLFKVIESSLILVKTQDVFSVVWKLSWIKVFSLYESKDRTKHKQNKLKLIENPWSYIFLFL